MRVNMQADLGSLLRQRRISGNRNGHLVAHSMHIHHKLVGTLLQKRAPKVRDHETENTACAGASLSIRFATATPRLREKTRATSPECFASNPANAMKSPTIATS